MSLLVCMRVRARLSQVVNLIPIIPVSYTHLDVYKRQNLVLISLKCFKLSKYSVASIVLLLLRLSPGINARIHARARAYTLKLMAFRQYDVEDSNL